MKKAIFVILAAALITACTKYTPRKRYKCNVNGVELITYSDTTPVIKTYDSTGNATTCNCVQTY